jgi:hypothetical protein
MNNTYPLLNVGGKAQLGNFAALPGTGPAGSVCSGCSLLTPDGSRFVCGKYRVLTGRKGKPISPGSAACRYFQQRPAFNATKGAV